MQRTITWKGSPNYFAGRTMPIREILIHWINGTLESADATFARESSQVSAASGYEDDRRHDYVRIEDTAWAARQANPFTINLELSAGPGRAPSDATYDSVIADCAAYVEKYDLSRDLTQSINPHKKYVATRCSGNDLEGNVVEDGGVDLRRIREGVKALLEGKQVPAPVVAPDKPSLPQPVANTRTAGTVSLPAAATKWRVYRETGPWTVGNEVGSLNPSLFGGLTYEILANPTANVYVIRTRDFGRVAVYAGPETGAQLAITAGQGITKGTGLSKTVQLPAVPTWRVYREGGPYVTGREIGYLAPAKYGGLAYAVLAQPAANVVVIQTQTFGRVAIYVGPETGATIN